MLSRLDRSRRTLPVILGVVTLADVGVLLVWDAFPQLFPPKTHDFLAAYALALIALAYLVYQIAHRPARMELAKAILLATAFLFWSANQLWPDLPLATLFNDIAIALFVFDIFLIMVGWPASSPDSSFAEPSGVCLNCCCGQTGITSGAKAETFECKPGN
jgi:hypothetical protein